MNIELNDKQVMFLADAMKWWQTSGVNFWSAQTAQEIEALVKEAYK